MIFNVEEWKRSPHLSSRLIQKCIESSGSSAATILTSVCVHKLTLFFFLHSSAIVRGFEQRWTLIAQETLKRSNRDLAPHMPVFARHQRADFLCTLLDMSEYKRLPANQKRPYSLIALQLISLSFFCAPHKQLCCVHMTIKTKLGINLLF